MLGKEIHSSWLQKKNRLGLWQRRFFSLTSDILHYYSGSTVSSFQLKDWQDVVSVGNKGRIRHHFLRNCS